MPPLISEFTFVGKLKKIIINSKDTVKYLKLITEEGKYWIKVTKELQKSLSEFQEQLQPGCSLKVTGKRIQKIKKGELVYKAYRIEFLSPESKTSVSSSKQNSEVAKAKAKVLFCQKSTCWKKGGKAAYELLQAELKSRGLENQVKIQKTGCLKQCKKAPNVVFMPDKARYSKLECKQLPTLIEKHLLIKKNN